MVVRPVEPIPSPIRSDGQLRFYTTAIDESFEGESTILELPAPKPINGAQASVGIDDPWATVGRTMPKPVVPEPKTDNYSADLSQVFGHPATHDQNGPKPSGKSFKKNYLNSVKQVAQKTIRRRTDLFTPDREVFPVRLRSQKK